MWGYRWGRVTWIKCLSVRHVQHFRGSPLHLEMLLRNFPLFSLSWEVTLKVALEMPWVGLPSIRRNQELLGLHKPCSFPPNGVSGRILNHSLTVGKEQPGALWEFIILCSWGASMDSWEDTFFAHIPQIFCLFNPASLGLCPGLLVQSTLTLVAYLPQNLNDHLYSPV